MSALTVTDAERLVELESVVERGLQTFIEVGDALGEIRSGRLYRDAGYTRFDDYCRERWGFARRYADRQIAAAGYVATLSPTGLIPENERQAREQERIAHAPEPSPLAEFPTDIDVIHQMPSRELYQLEVRGLMADDERYAAMSPTERMEWDRVEGEALRDAAHAATLAARAAESEPEPPVPEVTPDERMDEKYHAADAAYTVGHAAASALTDPDERHTALAANAARFAATRRTAAATRRTARALEPEVVDGEAVETVTGEVVESLGSAQELMRRASTRQRPDASTTYTRFQVEAAAHVAGLPPRYRNALLTALDAQAPRSF